MDPLSPPIERAIGALSEGSGRTIAIAGPPLSGKSRLLDSIREELTRREWRVFELQGIYRDRETPYAALANFGVDPGLSPATAIPPDTSGGLAASWLGAPMAPFSRVRSGDGRRRRRGGSDPSARIGGGGGGPPRRGGRVVDGPEVHSGLVRAVSEGTRPVALVIEDATLFDTESRNAIIHLCQRVRFRPILVVLALDVSLPAYGPWEDALQKCGGVEWVRILHPRPDPLEESRFRETFEALPEATRTALVVTAILGGSVSDVRLVRATRMSLAELANALAPALEANMVRVGGGRVTVSHAAWIDLLPSLAPQDVRQRIHREIAEALSALDPEPDLKHGLDLAEHLFEASHDHVALRHL
ncbi:MAG TPA: AAA family ATPase, partial [Thermoplasmata archaeon]|nr:AAA family ATPase [Thermoplasmata archaeon]